MSFHAFHEKKGDFLFLLLFFRELQQRIPNELLSELATCVIEGPVFEIVQGLKDVQNAEEKQLFKERLGVLRSHSSKFDDH